MGSVVAFQGDRLGDFEERFLFVGNIANTLAGIRNESGGVERVANFNQSLLDEEGLASNLVPPEIKATPSRIDRTIDDLRERFDRFINDSSN